MYRQLCKQAYGDLLDGFTLPADDTLTWCFEKSRYCFTAVTWDSIYCMLDASKSPGAPFANAGFRTNGDIPQDMLRECVEERINLLLFMEEDTTTDEWLPESRTMSEWAAYGVEDPVKVHVKAELTKKQKVARLIYGQSVISRCIWQWLYNDLLKKAPYRWTSSKNASSIGINFEDAHMLIDVITGYRSELPLMRAYSGLQSLDIASDDVSGWEYSVQPIMIDSALGVVEEHSIKYAGNTLSSKVHWSLRELFVSNPAAIVFSDGFIDEAPFVFLPSGWLLTHIINTVMRSALANLVLFKLDLDEDCSKRLILPRPYQKANGDDNIGFVSEHSLEGYRKLGFKTEREICTERYFGFCSQIFDCLKRVCYPETVLKTLSNFTFNVDSSEIYSQVRFVMKNRPDTAEIDGFLTWMRTTRWCHPDYQMVTENEVQVFE